MLWSNYLKRTEFPPDVADRKNMAFPLPKEPSIVVLPFVSVSETSDDLRIAETLSKNLYFILSREKDLFVISNLSSVKFKGRSLSIKETAEGLGVQFVISGSLERRPQDYRFFLIITDAFTGDRILAESFDTPWPDVGKLESLISAKILDTLGNSERITNSLDNKNKNHIRQKVWLRLSHQLFTRVQDDPKSLIDSIKSLEALNAEAPNIFEVLLEIALAYRLLYGMELNNFSLDRRDFVISQGIHYSDRAISVSNLESRAYSAKASFLELDGQHAKALKFKLRAAELGPNLFTPNWAWAIELEKQKKFEEALLFMSKSLRVHPLHPVKFLQNLAELQYKAGRPEAALATLSKLLETRPAFIPANLMKIFVLSSLRRIAEAKRTAHALLRVRPMFTLSNYLEKRPRYIYSYGPTWASFLQDAGLPH